MTRIPSFRAWVIAIAVAAVFVVGGLYGSNRAALQRRLLTTPPDSIALDARLDLYALSRGRVAYADHCASCHRQKGEGDPARAVPALNSGHWLYGTGRVAELEHTILYGIRSGHPKSRNLASMPAFGTPRPYLGYAIEPLTPGQIDDVANYVLRLRGLATNGKAAVRGSEIFHGSGGCYDCHGGDGGGDTAIGAPDLRSGVQVAGDGSAASIRTAIAQGLAGRCPAWIDRLTPVTIRALAVYVQSLAASAAGTTALDRH